MLDDQERQDRDPAAIQKELMQIDKEMDSVQKELEEYTEVMMQAKLNLDIAKSKKEHLKGRAMILQSVLRSVK